MSVEGAKAMRTTGLQWTFTPKIDVSERTIRKMHLPSHKRAIEEAKVYSIMTAHNEINGIPCHIDKHMMQDIARGKLGFDGFFVIKVFP